MRDKELAKQIENKYNLLSYPNISIISVITIGEIKSIALQNNWGETRTLRLDELIKQFLIADINAENIINKYAEIDTYSQGKNKDKRLIISSRNMGKNDLWIAATASVLNATLITTDNDFTHLQNEYLDLIKINIL